MHDVHTEVAGAYLAYERVHVGAVHVEQRALSMQDVGDLVDLALEDADGAGVGQHQRRDVFRDQVFERRHIDHAERIRLDVLHLVADNRSGRGIRAMRGVWDQHRFTRIAFGLVISASEQNPGELAVRSGGRLQRDRVHAGDLDQAVLQGADNL